MERTPAHGAFDLAPLPADERSRLRSFASPERRRQFVLGRLAARRLLGEHLGQAPDAVSIQLGADGAPRVENGFISIAHAGRGFDALGVAVHSAYPIGVDAEVIRPHHPRLADRITRPDESSVFDRLGSADANSLTLIWALKESVLKGQRTGLRAGAKSVRLVEIDVDSSMGRAESEQSGVWRLSFTRERNLWLAVALREEELA